MIIEVALDTIVAIKMVVDKKNDMGKAKEMDGGRGLDMDMKVMVIYESQTAKRAQRSKSRHT